MRKVTLALAAANSFFASVTMSTLYGLFSGNMIKPIFHGGLTPLKFFHGVSATGYGHGL